jgi:hypothetical protein
MRAILSCASLCCIYVAWLCPAAGAREAAVYSVTEYVGRLDAEISERLHDHSVTLSNQELETLRRVEAVGAERIAEDKGERLEEALRNARVIGEGIAQQPPHGDRVERVLQGSCPVYPFCR